MRLRGRLIALLILPIFASLSASSQIKSVSDKTLSRAEIDQVLLAVQDEIYDYGYQDDFSGFATSGEHGKIAQYSVYISPLAHWNSNSWQGEIIYKYPPFGEVIRSFFLGKGENSLVLLGGSPDSGFSWTQPNTQTIYADDDEICKDKHAWLRTSFYFDLEPSTGALKDAYSRQVQRKGSSRYGKKIAVGTP